MFPKIILPESWTIFRIQDLPLPGRPAQLRMFSVVRPIPPLVPDDAKRSSVLILTYQKEGEWYFALIRRFDDGKAHAGQIALPGGRAEQHDPDSWHTAIREAEEELGIPRLLIQPVRSLTQLYIPVSNSLVFPFVGYTETLPEWHMQAGEVDEVIEVRLQDLLQESNKTQSWVRSKADPHFHQKVPAYHFQETIVWGATAMILSEWEALLNQSVNDTSPKGPASSANKIM